MEVHVKRLHADKIFCGLCGFTTRKLETLETHMNTCETFKCLECQKLTTNISEIKEHMKTDHPGKNCWIRHCLSDRKFAEYYKENDYQSKELFGKKSKILLNSK